MLSDTFSCVLGAVPSRKLYSVVFQACFTRQTSTMGRHETGEDAPIPPDTIVPFVTNLKDDL